MKGEVWVVPKAEGGILERPKGGADNREEKQEERALYPGWVELMQAGARPLSLTAAPGPVTTARHRDLGTGLRLRWACSVPGR